MMKPILFFDYDGTIHETMHIYKPAIWRVVRYLNEEVGYPVEMPSDRKISSWLGMNTADMWRDFMPQLPEDLKRSCGKMVGGFMLEGLLDHKAKWYDEIPEVLDQLKAEGYQMVILSNCGVSYARTQWQEFGMERWFDVYFECETYHGIPKADIMKLITSDIAAAFERAPVKKEHAVPIENATTYMVIGDRYSDLSAAEAVGCAGIGCRYGYGSEEELKRASICIDSAKGILDAVHLLSSIQE